MEKKLLFFYFFLFLSVVSLGIGALSFQNYVDTISFTKWINNWTIIQIQSNYTYYNELHDLSLVNYEKLGINELIFRLSFMTAFISIALTFILKPKSLNKIISFDNNNEGAQDNGEGIKSEENTQQERI